MQIYRVISFLVLVFYIFLAMPHSMRDLSFLIRGHVPLYWKLRVLTTGPPQKSPVISFLYK